MGRNSRMNWRIPAYQIPKFKKISLVTPIVVLMIICTLVLVVGVGCYSLKKRQNVYNQEIEKYQVLLEKEKERSQEIQEYAMYTKTTAYYEEVAREKYRLVHDNEILFVTE